MPITRAIATGTGASPGVRGPANPLSRRTLALGAAWTVPAIALAAAAPAVAASTPHPPGLNGWVTIEKDCRPLSLDIDGRGTFTGGGTSDRGFWVFTTNSTTPPTGAYLVFYIPTSSLTWTWAAAAGNVGWSVPVMTTDNTIAPPIAGYTRYVTYYTWTWTYNSTHQAWVADGHLHVTATASSSPRQCPSISLYTYRSVTYDGQTISVTHGPVTL